MIELKVENYCQNCEDFKAEVNSVDVFTSFATIEHDHTIRCKHYLKCQRIYEHAKKDLAEKT